MTVNIEQLPMRGMSSKRSSWIGAFLGVGTSTTIDVPIQEGALFLKPDVEGLEVFTVQLMTGIAPVEMAVSARMTYEGVELIDSDIIIPKGKEKIITFQVNQKLDEKAPVNFRFSIARGEPGKHLSPAIMMHQPTQWDTTFRANSGSTVCRKGDGDYGVIVEKSTGKLYRGFWLDSYFNN